jgi:subtilisin family serine protease
MLDACSRHVDLLNMSIVGYLSPDDPFDVEDYLLFADAVDYCRAQGTTVFAAAGNEHVRINRVNLTIGGRALTGVGQVDTGADGFANMAPGGSEALDLRGLLEVPAGVPGVVMVSATNNAIGDAPASVALRWKQHVGARDQLAYYSSYGSRVDLAAPGGARRFNIPSYDGGPDDILYGGWGSLGALSRRGEICTDPSLASPQTFACFTLGSAAFGWLQGTSMSSPNATGVAALLLSAHSELRGNPSGVLSRLQATARRNMTNFMGGNDGSNFAPAFDGSPCATAYCHVVQDRPVAFADAYGAGLVDAAAAVAR